MGQRKQLWILLSVFVGMGLFAGLTMWQISQFQLKDRDIARVKTELEQTKQQIQILQDTNKAAISSRGKLQKDFTAAQKLLTTFQQKGQALEKQLSEAKLKLLDASKVQEDNKKLLEDNKKLLEDNKRLNDLVQKSSRGGDGVSKSSPKETITPNPFK